MRMLRESSSAFWLFYTHPLPTMLLFAILQSSNFRKWQNGHIRPGWRGSQKGSQSAAELSHVLSGNNRRGEKQCIQIKLCDWFWWLHLPANIAVFGTFIPLNLLCIKCLQLVLYGSGCLSNSWGCSACSHWSYIPISIKRQLRWSFQENQWCEYRTVPYRLHDSDYLWNCGA